MHSTDEHGDSARAATVDDWLDAVVYYGVGQVLFLGFPALWLAFQSVTNPVAVTTAVVLAATVVPLTIGTLRLGLLTAGPPWVGIDDEPLGLGPDAGYGFLLRRAAFLNGTIGLATFAGARVDAAGWGLSGSLVVAGGISAIAVLALPAVRASDAAWSVVARAAYYGTSLFVVGTYGRLWDVTVGAPSAVLAFGALCCLALFDVASSLR